MLAGACLAFLKVSSSVLVCWREAAREATVLSVASARRVL